MDKFVNKDLKTKYILYSITILLFIVSFCSLFLGRYYVEPREVFQILLQRIMGISIKSKEATVVWNIRLPRVLLNILVGGGLGLAGASFQGVFQNPLVSPDILGVSNGAGFGASLGMLLTTGVTNITTIFAFGFGLLSVFITYIIPKIKKDRTSLSLVLSGIVVGSIFNALISLIKLVADTESALPAITYWLMGSFANTTFHDLRLVSIPIIGGIMTLLSLRWRINILSMGDEEAYSLGVNPVKTRLITIIACTIITAASVTVTGIIGWIGMVLPNICRRYVSVDHKYLLPASCITGAIFMVIVDFLARTITPSEIPIGILTALVGAPFFILTYGRKSGEGN